MCRETRTAEARNAHITEQRQEFDCVGRPGRRRGTALRAGRRQDEHIASEMHRARQRRVQR